VSLSLSHLLFLFVWFPASSSSFSCMFYFAETVSLSLIDASAGSA
jgi:hypothetical protein